MRGRVVAAPEAPVVFGSPPGPGLFNGRLMAAPRGRARRTTTPETAGRQGRSGTRGRRNWGSVWVGAATTIVDAESEGRTCARPAAGAVAPRRACPRARPRRPQRSGAHRPRSEFTTTREEPPNGSPPTARGRGLRPAPPCTRQVVGVALGRSEVLSRPCCCGCCGTGCHARLRRERRRWRRRHSLRPRH